MLFPHIVIFQTREWTARISRHPREEARRVIAARERVTGSLCPAGFDSADAVETRPQPASTSDKTASRHEKRRYECNMMM